MQKVKETTAYCCNGGCGDVSMYAPVAKQAKKKVALADLLAFKHDGVIERLINKENMDKGTANKAFIEMLRFLYLCNISEKPVSPSEIADEAWHAFILFTKDYHKFCDDFFGHYMHHQPFDGRPELKEKMPEIIAHTIGLLKKEFNQDSWGISKN